MLSGDHSMDKKASLTKKQTLALLILAGIVVLAALVLAYISLRYTDGFLAKTTVNGISCGGETPADTCDLLWQAADAATFTLTDDRGEVVVSMPLTKLADKAGLKARLEELWIRQHEGVGFLGWMSWQGGDEHIPLLQELTPARLEKVIYETYYADAAHASPTNSAITFTDTGYTLTPADDGHEIRADICAADAYGALAALTAPEDVQAATASGVVRAILPEDGDIRTGQVAVLDAYLGQNIAIDFGNGNVIRLTPEMIGCISDLSLDGTSAVCAPSFEKAAVLIRELCDRYADDGVYAKFRNVAKTRELVYYRVGDTGWRLDTDALAWELCDALRSGRDAVLEPVYDYTWYWLEQYPYNFYLDELTYVEISLDNQYMWFYKDGDLVVETPVVTGCLANHDYTNRGFFRIAYKEEDCMLTGPTWNDHVDYWMPFDGNIGMHDSSWRDEYGGDIYLENGSHGCINTPLEAMSTIYNNIDSGAVIIVY